MSERIHFPTSVNLRRFVYTIYKGAAADERCVDGYRFEKLGGGKP